MSETGTRDDLDQCSSLRLYGAKIQLMAGMQVVSDYLTAYDGEGLSIRAQNRPVTIYTYKMAFRRIKDGQGLAI